VQVTRGLHGAVVVLGPDEPTFDADRILVLGDANLDGQHSGQALLINGHEAPEYEIAAGQVERWRIVNASSGRYVLLSLGGLPFRIIGADGGLCDRPVTATETLLTPGDRVELAVGPFEEEGASRPRTGR
jgi:FtsP/CotA-like multicopper oxidase with cupredoxin domain